MFDVQGLYQSKVQAVNDRYIGYLNSAFGSSTGFADILGQAIGAGYVEGGDAVSSGSYTPGMTDELASGVYSEYYAAMRAQQQQASQAARAELAGQGQTASLNTLTQSTGGVIRSQGNPKTIGMTPAEYEPLIEAASAKYGVDVELIRGIMRAESSFNPNCVSSAGAKGLMQLMHYHTGDIDPYDPAQNIDRGVEHFKDYLDRFDGDLRLGLAAYNCGYYRVSRDLGITSSSSEDYFKLSDRVRRYVERVLDYSGYTNSASA